MQKASALRDAAERSRDEALRQLEVHQTGIEALQSKLQSAVDKIHKGNEVSRAGCQSASVVSLCICVCVCVCVCLCICTGFVWVSFSPLILCGQTIRQLQVEGAALKSKLQAKNEVIRKQETVVQEQRGRVADLSRQLASRDDALAVGSKQRDLLERELAEAKKSVAEGAELVQKNEEVCVSMSVCLSVSDSDS